jgi:hypothetical protein
VVGREVGGHIEPERRDRGEHATLVGYVVGQPLLVSMLGAIAAAGMTAVVLARSPAHQLSG